MQIRFKHQFTVFIFFIFSYVATAQLHKGQSINATIGLGASSPYDEVDITATGFFAEVEYAINFKKWVGFRPYTSVVFTSTDQDNLAFGLQGFEIKTNTWMLGGKFRLQAPIPYVAPYIEAGIGLSVGGFVTRTPLTNKDLSGVLVHIPWTIGLSIGKNHGTDIEFAYFFIPQAEQVVGGVGIGLCFLIPKKE